jgi:hypothetical protein
MKTALAWLVIVASSSIGYADTIVLDENDSPYTLPPCTDPSDVVGYRACPAYGAWGDNLLAPYVFVDIGVNFWTFSGLSGGANASTARSVDSASGSSTARSTDRLITYDERVGVGFAYGLYLAFDFELSAFAEPPTTTTSGLLALLSAGIQHKLGPITLGGEITGGVLAYSPETSTDLAAERVLEARGRADLWLTPWFTIGGVAGESLFHDGWMAGFQIGLHTHAYGRR